MAALPAYVSPSPVHPGDVVVVFVKPLAPTDTAYLAPANDSGHFPLAAPPGPPFVAMARSLVPPAGHASCAAPLGCFVVPHVQPGFYWLYFGHSGSWNVAGLDQYACIELHRRHPERGCDALQVTLPQTDTIRVLPTVPAAGAPWPLIAITASIVVFLFERRRRAS
jgi:hypothetical protein